MSHCWYGGDPPVTDKHISVLFEEPSTHQSPTLDFVNKPAYFEGVPLRIDNGSYLCITVNNMCPRNVTFGARPASNFRAFLQPGVSSLLMLNPATGLYPEISTVASCPLRVSLVS
jgi:hypothetical protein